MYAKPKYHTNLKALCDDVSIQATENPKREMWDDSQMRRFACTLYFEDREFIVDYWQSVGVRRLPSAYDVLCHFLNIAAGDSEPYSMWADDLGLDPSDAHTQSAYKKMRYDTDRLKQFLAKHFSTFLFAEQE